MSGVPNYHSYYGIARTSHKHGQYMMAICGSVVVVIILGCLWLYISHRQHQQTEVEYHRKHQHQYTHENIPNNYNNIPLRTTTTHSTTTTTIHDSKGNAQNQQNQQFQDSQDSAVKERSTLGDLLASTLPPKFKVMATPHRRSISQSQHSEKVQAMLNKGKRLLHL